MILYIHTKFQPIPMKNRPIIPFLYSPINCNSTETLFMICHLYTKQWNCPDLNSGHTIRVAQHLRKKGRLVRIQPADTMIMSLKPEPLDYAVFGIKCLKFDTIFLSIGVFVWGRGFKKIVF